MKKYIAIMLALSVVGSVAGVRAEECVYAPEQEVVRRAENTNEIWALGGTFDANKTFPCGGTLTQLALLRGNIDNMDYLVKHGADLNAEVSLAGYEIADAPETVPFPLFAARYSPNSAMIDYMLNEGINFKITDSKGHDVFWYFEQNPVLRSTYLTKKGEKSLMSVREIVDLINNGGTYE